jgi:hypothetical protein
VPQQVFAGIGSAGTATTISAGDHVHTLGANVPTLGMVPVISTSTTLSTGTSTSTNSNINWGYLQEGHVTNLVSDLAGKQPTLPGAKEGQVFMGGTGTATGTATTTTTTITPHDPPWTNTPLATNAIIVGSTGTATASTTVTSAMPADARVSLRPTIQITARAGTTTAVSTATQCAPGDEMVSLGTTVPNYGMALFAGGTNAGTSTFTSTSPVWSYMNENTIQNLPGDLAGKQASLGSSTQGAVLYNGSTATGTNTTSSPVWGPPAAAGMACGGSCTIGYVPKFTDATHIGNGLAQDDGTNFSVYGTLYSNNMSQTPTANYIPLAKSTGILDPGYVASGSRSTGWVPTITAGGTAAWAAPPGGSGLTGGGTTNYMTKWSGSGSLTNSIAQDDGTTITVSGYIAASNISGTPGASIISKAGSTGVLDPGFLASGSRSTGMVPTLNVSGAAVWTTPSAGSGLSGGGTAGYIAQWSSATGLTNSIAQSDGTNFTVNGNLLAGNVSASAGLSTIPVTSGSVSYLDPAFIASGSRSIGMVPTIGPSSTSQVTWTSPTAHQVRAINIATLSGTTSTTSDHNWTTFLSVATSGAAGTVVANGAVAFSGNNGDSCKAMLAIDSSSTPIGGELIGGIPANAYVSLSPVGAAAFASGSHNILLLAAGPQGQCTSLLSGSINRATLTVTEYTP